MTQAELSKREERARRETFVIQKTAEGFRVYPPGNPTRNYLVIPDAGSPICTCPDFEVHAGDPDWRCKHILAVENRNGGDIAEGDAGDKPDATPGRHGSEARPNGRTPVAQMLLKRSVSPDGRIDSLSVEFAVPAENVPAQEMRRHARHVLDLQNEIVNEFLGPEKNGNRGHESTPGVPAVPARLLRVGGIDTKWGRRLFIQVQVNGDTLKLFGSPKQLAEALEGAGYDGSARRIEEGVTLNLPCKVTTKPSDDGRYVNVDALFPPDPPRGNGRGRR